MNDGIERAIGRATELESLVHREISTLERAYGENEIRIRSLIDELITQREGIATHSERVRDVIADTHIKLSTELSAATAKLTGSLDETGTRVVETLHGRSELVTSALGQAGERIMAEIGARGADLTERLLAATDAVGRQLGSFGRRDHGGDGAPLEGCHRSSRLDYRRGLPGDRDARRGRDAGPRGNGLAGDATARRGRGCA